MNPIVLVLVVITGFNLFSKGLENTSDREFLVSQQISVGQMPPREVPAQPGLIWLHDKSVEQRKEFFKTHVMKNGIWIKL